MTTRSIALLMAWTVLGGAAHAQGTRDVQYTDRTVVSVHARVRFTTLIMLPADEQILDFVCGDKDYWIVSGADNLAYVKPAKEGAATNLHLITASGRVYSFLLTESSGDPDLTLYVMPDDGDARARGPRRLYAAEEVEALRRAVDDARAEAASVREASAQAADAAIAQIRARYPVQLQFPYRFRADEKPFFVSAIYHDGQFTYIRARSAELPALYEWRDDAPNLVPFQVEQGVYIVPKVLDRGYLAIGKARFFFAQATAR